MEIKLKLKLPKMPNYLFTEVGNRQVDVKDLTVEQIKALGEEWTEALIKHAENRRNKL